MAQQDKCIGCGRPQMAVRDRVVQCEYANNRTVERCAWLALQKQVPHDVSSADAPFAQQLQTVQQQLAAALLETEQIKKRLDTETATRIAAQEQAAQHKAVADHAHEQHSILQSAFVQLKKAASDSAPASPLAPVGVSPSSQTSMLGLMPRVISWIVATRAKVGSIGAVLGLVLGAGGVWWQSSPSPPPSAPVTQKPEPPAPKPKPRPQVSAIDMHTRLAAAGLNVPMRVEENLQNVHVDVEPGDVSTRDKAALVVKSVFAGAGLRTPVIHFPVVPGKVAQVPARPLSEVPEPRKAAPQPPKKPREGSPEIKPIPPPPVPSPPTSLEAMCRNKLNSGILESALGWKLFSCMKNECCKEGMIENQECSSYNQKFPLNCRR